MGQTTNTAMAGEQKEITAACMDRFFMRMSTSDEDLKREGEREGTAFAISMRFSVVEQYKVKVRLDGTLE